MRGADADARIGAFPLAVVAGVGCFLGRVGPHANKNAFNTAKNTK